MIDIATQALQADPPQHDDPFEIEEVEIVPRAEVVPAMVGKRQSAAKLKAAKVAEALEAIKAARRRPETFRDIHEYAAWKSAQDRCVDILEEMVEMVRSKGAKGPVGGGPQDVRTPKPFFDFVAWKLAREYGGRFVRDLAASPENALCPLYFTEEDNALKQQWHLHCGGNEWAWDNPPFGNSEPWVKLANAETLLGARVVQLLRMALGTGWFQRHVKGGPCTVLRMAGRLPFIGYEGASANFDTMILVWHGGDYEEVDWHWRLEMAHWAIIHGREAEVLEWHKGMAKWFKQARAEIREAERP